MEGKTVKLSLFADDMVLYIEIHISNLRYADDTTLMAEREEELKSLLMRVKRESEKASLKFNIQKTTIMTFKLITSFRLITNKKGKSGSSDRFYFPELQNHCRR